MSFDAGSIKGRMILDLSGWKNNVRKVLEDERGIQRSLDRIKDGARQAGATLSIMGAAAQVAFGMAIKSAMDMEEAENLFTVSLGHMADETRAWSEQLASSIGLSSAKVREQTAVLVDITSAMGFTRESAVAMSRELVKVANDLASFKNLDVETAFQKIRSGMTGETEGLKAIGILVDENTIKLAAYRHGIAKFGEELNAQQRVAARLAAILDQTKNAQGDLARTADSATNQTRRFWSQMEVLRTTIGNYLLPGFTSLVTKANQWMAAANQIAQANPELVGGLVRAAAATTAVAAALGGAAFVVPKLASALVGLGKIGVGAMGLLISPIGLVVAGLTMMGAAVIVVRATWEKGFKQIAQGIAGFATDVGRIVASIVSNFTEAMGVLWSNWKGVLSTMAQAVATWANQTIGYFVGAFKAVTALWQGGGIDGAISEAMGALDGDYVGGAIEKIKGLAGYIKTDFVPDVVDAFEGVKWTAGILWNEIGDQAREDIDGIKSYIATQFPGIMAQIEAFNSAVKGATPFEGYGDVDFEKIMSGVNPDMLAGEGGAGGAAAKKAKAARDKAAEELKRLSEQGDALYGDILPDVGVIRRMTEDMMALKAAGRLDDIEPSILSGHYWDQIKDKSAATIQAIIDKAAALDDAFGTSFAEGLASRMTGDEQQRQIDLGNQLYQSLAPTQVLLDEMKINVEALKAAGRLDEETTNILAQSYWADFANRAGENMEGLLEKIKAVAPELAKQFEIAIAKQKELTEKDKLMEMADRWSGLAGAIAQLPGNFKYAAAAAQMASRIMRIAALAAGDPWAAVTLAIEGIAEAFGLVGEKTEEVKTGMDKFLEELGTAVEEWGDQFTDMLVEFLETGQFSFKEFVNSILADIARLTIQTTITDPIVNAIQGAFAKGAAFSGGKVVPFAKGGVTMGATAFPMAGGKMGLMGEAGPEAIMPLHRTSDGGLGVKATGGVKVVVNNMTGHQGAVQVEEVRDSDGGTALRITVRDIVSELLQGGHFDRPMAAAFGARRVPRGGHRI